jgi:hypothetical protein
MKDPIKIFGVQDAEGNILDNYQDMYVDCSGRERLSFTLTSQQQTIVIFLRLVVAPLPKRRLQTTTSSRIFLHRDASTGRSAAQIVQRRLPFTLRHLGSFTARRRYRIPLLSCDARLHWLSVFTHVMRHTTEPETPKSDFRCAAI